MAPQGDLQLSIGYWIVSHKKTLQTWWAISLMLVMAAGLVGMVVFFTVFLSQDSKVNNFISQAASGTGSFLVSNFQPRDLTIGQVDVIIRDQTHIDLLGRLTNNNPAWAATAVKIHFLVNGQSVATADVFINQNSSRPIIQTNVAVANSTNATASLVVDNTTWTQTTAASLPEPKFTVIKSTVTPSNVTWRTETRATITLHAEVSNQSVYNYYRVIVPIVVKNGDRPVAVDQLTLDRWPTLTSKTIDLVWPYEVTGATSATIEPQVSRYDLNNIYR